MDFTGIMFAVIPATVVIIIAVIYNNNSKKREAYKLDLWNEYQAALRSGDKQLALNAGRKYFGFLRPNGRLTIYDEQALSNDLNVMK